MADAELIDLQQQRGAHFADGQAGMAGPLHFGNPAAEYAAARESAVVFDVSNRTQIELGGGDRAKFLNNFCTNEILSLGPGEGREAFVTNIKGRVLAHVFVFVAPDSIWVETVGGAEDSLLNHLDRYLIAEDVTLNGRTAECGELFVSGPGSFEMLAELHVNLASLPLYGHTQVVAFDLPVFARSVDWLGAPAALLSVPRDSLPSLWRQLTEGGLPPAGAQAFDALRIEAGMPLYGRDITEENIAQEAGRTERAISFTKGCYLGQEPIARIDALGHVNRELRGLRLAEAPVPTNGSSVTGPDDDKEIGRVTSAALCYADNRPLALAYLRSKFVAPGTEVHVDVDGRKQSAVVFWPHA